MLILGKLTSVKSWIELSVRSVLLLVLIFKFKELLCQHIKAVVVLSRHIKALVECHDLIGHVLIKNE